MSEHRSHFPRSCGGDLQLLYYQGKPSWHGYAYHNPKNVRTQVENHIAHLRNDADVLQAWLDNLSTEEAKK